MPKFDDPKKKNIKSQRKPSSPPKQSPFLSLLLSLLPLNTLIPTVINVQPLQVVPPSNVAVNQPWGQNIGPLNLGVNPTPLPKGATKVLPIFSGDGNFDRGSDKCLSFILHYNKCSHTRNYYNIFCVDINWCCHRLI